MRVVVTGSAGKIGRAAVRALQDAGHDVVGFDTGAPSWDAAALPVDCTDFGQVMGALTGVDVVGGVPEAVVHLAGIPAPGLAPDHVVFDTNTRALYNVLSACARLGVPRVVWGSSETLLGLPFTIPPAYLPLDEDAPVRPQFHYALSKQLCETMAETFTTWHQDLTVVSLRFSNVFADTDRENLKEAQHPTEARKLNLWGYVDAADAGRACQLAVQADLHGHHRYLIAAADTISDVPSAELVRRFYPDVEIRSPLTGHTSLLSTRRATDELGYRPQVSWRDW